MKIFIELFKYFYHTICNLILQPLRISISFIVSVMNIQLFSDEDMDTEEPKSKPFPKPTSSRGRTGTRSRTTGEELVCLLLNINNISNNHIYIYNWPTSNNYNYINYDHSYKVVAYVIVTQHRYHYTVHVYESRYFTTLNQP